MTTKFCAPKRKSFSPFYVLLLLAILVMLNSCGENGADENELKLYLPDDLEATLWAESPLFYNPTNMDIDRKGRVWITEAVNYRNYNNDSTKTLHHNKGDRVMILEDTDGDGKADHSKVFVQDKDLVSPLGIAVIGNKVYVSCSPNLIVYTDENGDDVPDSKEIFLTGFGGKDHDHSLHAVIGSVDGYLYFNTGNAGPHVVTDKSGWTLRSGSMYTGGSPYNKENKGNMKSDDGKVWVGGLALKIHPEGKGLSIAGHNFRNAYELFVDSRGDMWQNDNDDQVVTCRTTWLMEGGNAGYFSTDGTRSWQADQRPGQDIFSAHWHQEDPGVIPAGDRSGAGSPTGVVMNEEDGLGEKYRGMLLSADAGRNVIFGYHPSVSQSGYNVGGRENFITSLQQDNDDYVWNDSLDNTDHLKWFRPSDVAMGTEGAIYVADWYDPVVGGHQMHDTLGYGRIYRITPKNKKLSRPEIDLTTSDGLIDAANNPAVNVRYEAYQHILANGSSMIDPLRKMILSSNPFHQARAIWLLAALGDEGKKEVELLLHDKNEAIRVDAFRALRRYSTDVLPYAEKMVSDPSGFVRREVIISLTDYPYPTKKAILSAALKNFDANDRWYLEALGTAVTGEEEDFMKSVSEVWNANHLPATQWSNEMEALAWRLHPATYVPSFSQRASSTELTTEQRQRALTALAFVNNRQAALAMISLTKSKLTDVADQANYWVAFRQSNDWFNVIDWAGVNFDPAHERKVAEMKVRRSKILDEKMPADEMKRDAREMAKDPIGGNMILALVSEGKFPKELYKEVSKNILNNPDVTIRVQASQYFSSSDGQSYVLPEIIALPSDAIKGREIFNAQCSSCHRVGKTGNDIGPDLTEIKKKFNKESVMDAVVNPSAGIVFGYEAWTINTEDGQSHFGFLVADGKDVVVIKDLTGVKQSIPVGSITSRKQSDRSVMPTASALSLTDQELADVVAFLATQF